MYSGVHRLRGTIWVNKGNTGRKPAPRLPDQKQALQAETPLSLGIWVIETCFLAGDRYSNAYLVHVSFANHGAPFSCGLSWTPATIFSAQTNLGFRASSCSFGGVGFPLEQKWGQQSAGRDCREAVISITEVFLSRSKYFWRMAQAELILSLNSRQIFMWALALLFMLLWLW